MVQRIFEVSTSPDNNNMAAILEIVAPLLNDVEIRGTISPPSYVKNLMLIKLLTVRNKVFNGILSVRPALYFCTTRDKKSFFAA